MSTQPLKETITQKPISEIVGEFRQKFGDDNVWKDASGETAFVAIGNIEDWLTTTLEADRKATQEETRKRVTSILELELGEDTETRIALDRWETELLRLSNDISSKEWEYASRHRTQHARWMLL